MLLFEGVEEICAECRGGGTGRRRGLKIPRGRPHEGSIPSPGTIFYFLFQIKILRHEKNRVSCIEQPTRFFVSIWSEVYEPVIFSSPAALGAKWNYSKISYKMFHVEHFDVNAANIVVCSNFCLKSFLKIFSLRGRNAFWHEIVLKIFGDGKISHTEKFPKRDFFGPSKNFSCKNFGIKIVDQIFAADIPIDDSVFQVVF